MCRCPHRASSVTRLSGGSCLSSLRYVCSLCSSSDRTVETTAYQYTTVFIFNMAFMHAWQFFNTKAWANSVKTDNDRISEICDENNMATFNEFMHMSSALFNYFLRADVPAALSQSGLCAFGMNSKLCRRICFRAPEMSTMESSSVSRSVPLGETLRAWTSLLIWGATPQRRYKPSTFSPETKHRTSYKRLPFDVFHIDQALICGPGCWLVNPAL